MNNQKPDSILIHTLKALIPYTKENADLSYHPNKFFNDLEKISKAKRETLASTLSRAQRQGLVERIEGIPRLTEAGMWRVKLRTKAPSLEKSWLVMVFDIPERRRIKRDVLRKEIKKLGFMQLQKSVWVCRQDAVKEIKQIIVDLKVEPYVLLIEGQPLIKYKILRNERFT